MTKTYLPNHMNETPTKPSKRREERIAALAICRRLVAVFDGKSTEMLMDVATDARVLIEKVET